MTPPTDERPFFFNQLPLYNPFQTLRLAFAIGTTHVTSGNLLATVTLMGLFTCRPSSWAPRSFSPYVQRMPGQPPAGGGGDSLFSPHWGRLYERRNRPLATPQCVSRASHVCPEHCAVFHNPRHRGGESAIRRVPLETRRRFMLWAVLLGGYLGFLPLWLPELTGRFASATLLVRAILCVMVIAPAGVLMGYGFPTGMRLVSAVDPHQHHGSGASTVPPVSWRRRLPWHAAWPLASVRHSL